MPRIEITVRESGRALRRAFVEHLVFGVGQDRLYLTDEQGRVRDQDGNPGIDSFTDHADVRVLGQNSVVKMLDGGTVGPLAVYQDVSGVRNTNREAAVINLNTAAEQQRHYDLANRFLVAYEVIFAQFQAFSELPAPDFPLGRRPTLRQTKDGPRIEVSFPSGSTPERPWTEPSSAATGLPLIQLGAAHFSERNTVVAAELSHALHFARFTQARRNSIEIDYAAWIAGELAAGRPGTHGVGVRSTPMVAYLEAVDQFSKRFSEYIRIVEQDNASRVGIQPMTSDIRRAFMARELSDEGPVTGVRVGRLLPGGTIEPAALLQGSTDEGSVYGCIFLDFGRRVGLRTAVNLYFRSASAGARTFGQYKSYVAQTRPQDLSALEAAQATWGL